MPRFDLTPTQRRAIDTLDWLYSLDDEARATGRTTVLVLNLLRRLILTQEANMRRGGWLPVSDHAASRDMDRHLVREAVHIAAECGFTGGIEVHPSGTQVRISPGARITHMLVEAISEFGDRPEESLGLPVRERIVREPLAASGVPSLPSLAAQERSERQRMLREMMTRTPAQAEPPSVASLWDHLTDADDD
jgi:hypothetical protein